MSVVEVIIERWDNADGSTNYLWSAWSEGRRIHMGGQFDSAEAAEVEANLFCRRSFGADPDRTRRL